MNRILSITSLALSTLIATSLVTHSFAAEAGAKLPAAGGAAGTCPMAEMKMPAMGGRMNGPPGAPPGAIGPPPGGGAPGGPPRIPMATTIAASDTSTSTVIHPDSKDQISCGKTPIKTVNDVVYVTRTLSDGKSMALLMDIQVPEPGKKRPLVVHVTGGGFGFAMKENALNLRTYVAEAGFVVASIQYRTIPNGATYKDGVADVKSAVRYLRANADKYGIDATKVALWGESAGGYLVSMVGVTNGDKSFDVGNNLDQSSSVQSVIDKFGPSDIAKVAADFDPQAQAEYVNSPVYLYAPRDLAAANPLSYVTAANKAMPPFLIFSGNQDKLVSPSQTLILHNALNAAGGHSTRYVLDGAGHGDMAFLGDLAGGLPWSTNQTMGLMVDFLKHTIGDAKR